MTDTRSSPVTEVLRLLQASTCFRPGSACGSLPCACAESLAALLTPAQSHLQRSELDDASNACSELAAKHGYATGHGDTVADMIREFSAQIPCVAQAAPELPPVEEIARVMWEGDHDGSWDDPLANPKMTREIYMGNAKDALAVVRQWVSPLSSTDRP